MLTRFGKFLYNPMEVVEFAQNSLQRYREACASELENDPFSSSVRWKLPAQGYVKIHFDGARFDNIAASGIGIIVRKSLWRFFGSVVQAFSFFIQLNTLKRLQRYKQFNWLFSSIFPQLS